VPVVPLARGKQGSPNDAITPEERNRIAASLRGNEQAPTSREQTAASINWRQIFDQLGNPFSNERLSVSRLKLMRRDPIIGFGLSFIRTPLMKADWYIKCSDAAIAGFIDEALRDIYPSLVIQITQSLDFGFQAIAKRFELRTPDGTYIDPADETQTEKPVWQQGTVQPLMWKTFVPLEPETVQPIFDDNTGEFAGINWKPTNANAVPKRTGMKTAASGSFDIDLYHSLWATNERESVGGNIYGYPRLGYAYQYWWSYWFRWAIADRAFEKKADPSIIVRHPEGQFVDEQTGSTMSFRDYALLMGDRLRSGSTVALPSEPYLGFEDRPSNTPQWDISFLTDGFDFNPFDESFTYLDTAKLRALWIPEQALIEGRGGTSSRNVASTFGDAFADSQEVLMKTVDEIINRYIIPQLVITNFPEFVGSCKKITKGFTSDDVAFQKQLIQLIGQQESGQAEMAKLVDMQELLKDAKVPLRSFQAQQLYEQQQQELAQQQQPTEIAPVPGQAAGVTPNPGSALGFSYVQPPEMIVLSDTQTEFASTLAQLPHFQDSVVRTHARGLWGVWKKQYGNAYASFVDYLETLEQIELADDEDQGSVFDWEFSASRSARKAALKLIDAWEGATTDLPDTITRTTDLVRRTIKRASLVARRQHLLPSAPSQDTINDYASQHASDIVTSAMQTTRDELVTFVANQIDSGITDAKQLARAVNEHFGDFPKWKADRLARTAITEAINAANLLTMEASGVEQAQAIDGADDPECSKRNGRLYPIRDALNVRDHPNGTLAWRPGFSLTDIHYAPAEEFETGARGEYDFDSQVITFSDAISDAEQGQFLLELGDYLRDSGS
jgi:hypothetical protein